MKPETTTDTVLDFPVSQYGSFLATRGVARTARNSLEAQVEAVPDEGLLVIRLDGVDAMTISFADEFLGRFYSDLSSGDVSTAGVVLSGLNEETREAAAICLERRDLVAVAMTDDGPTLLGRTEVLRETYTAALSLGSFRATEIGAALSITPQNANNRLKRLVEAGALVRRRVPVSDRGGKEFVYAVVPAAH